MAADQIFVSYSHENSAVVASDLDAMRVRGIDPWWDRKLTPGNTWLDELAEAIDNSTAVLFYASRESIDSTYCVQEISYAVSRDIPVLTVFLEDFRLPPGLALALNRRQQLHRFALEEAQYKDSLGKAIQQLINQSEMRAHLDARAIAVLRFENLSSDSENAYLAAGIAQELLTGLAQTEGVRVASRKAAFAFGETPTNLDALAAELGVAWVLGGSVQRAGDRIRVSVQLHHTPTGAVEWAERFDRDLKDIFDLQDEIAETVLGSVLERFEPDAPGRLLQVGTDDAIAYDMYLGARHEIFKFTPEAIEGAVVRLREAIRMDPKFLRARVQLMTALDALRMSFGRSDLQEEVSAVRAELRSLDPEGRTINWKLWDQLSAYDVAQRFEARERIFAEMLADPEHPERTGMAADKWWAGGFSVDREGIDVIDAAAQYGLLLAQAGMYRTGLAYLNSTDTRSSVRAYLCVIGGDLPAAKETLEECLVADPHVFINHAAYHALLLRMKLDDEADSYLDRMRPLMNADAYANAMLTAAYWREDEAGIVKWSEGLHDRKVVRTFLGILGAIGDVDRALDHFERAVADGEPYMQSIRIWAPGLLRADTWASLAQSERMQSLLDEIGLTQAWRDKLRSRAMSATAITGIPVMD